MAYITYNLNLTTSLNTQELKARLYTLRMPDVVTGTPVEAFKFQMCQDSSAIIAVQMRSRFLKCRCQYVTVMLCCYVPCNSSKSKMNFKFNFFACLLQLPAKQHGKYF